MIYWKQQVVSILRDPLMETTLIKEFQRHAPGRDCSILLDAFKNYFSHTNPGFEQNWYLFPNGVKVTISREGILFKAPKESAQEVLDDAEYSQWLVCERLTKDRWSRVFLGKYPDIED
jgi:hypothetical protein